MRICARLCMCYACCVSVQLFHARVLPGVRACACACAYLCMVCACSCLSVSMPVMWSSRLHVMHGASYIDWRSGRREHVMVGEQHAIEHAHQPTCACTRHVMRRSDVALPYWRRMEPSRLMHGDDLDEVLDAVMPPQPVSRIIRVGGEPARVGHACYMCRQITAGEFREWLCHECDDKNREVSGMRGWMSRHVAAPYRIVSCHGM